MSRTPTINANDHQSAHLTDPSPGTFERAAQEPSRITSSSTAAVHASSNATSRHHLAQPPGSSPGPQAGGTTTQTPPAAIPAWGAHYQNELMDSQGRTACRCGGEGRGGRVKAMEWGGWANKWWGEGAGGGVGRGGAWARQRTGGWWRAGFSPKVVLWSI